MKLLKPFIILIAACALFACSASHKAGTVTKASAFAAILEHAKKDKSYITLQSGINLYSVVLVEINKPRQEMTLQLNKPDTAKINNVTNAGKNAYTNDKTSAGTNRQTHILMNDSISYTLDEPHTLMLAKIAKIEITK